MAWYDQGKCNQGNQGSCCLLLERENLLQTHRRYRLSFAAFLYVWAHTYEPNLSATSWWDGTTMWHYFRPANVFIILVGLSQSPHLFLWAASKLWLLCLESIFFLVRIPKTSLETRFHCSVSSIIMPARFSLVKFRNLRKHSLSSWSNPTLALYDSVFCWVIRSTVGLSTTASWTFCIRMRHCWNYPRPERNCVK